LHNKSIFGGVQTGRSIKFQYKFFVELSRPPRPLPSRKLRNVFFGRVHPA
jgi:hypothetical protein